MRSTDKIILGLVSLVESFIVLAWLGIADSLPAQTLNQPRSVHSQIPLTPNDSLIQLQYRFIIPASDSLRLGNHLLRPDLDYQIDYRTGDIHLLFRPVVGDTLQLSYRAVPLDIEPSYRFLPFILWHKSTTDSSGSGRVPEMSGSRQIPTGRDKPTDLFTDSQLRKSGSITRSITVGSNQGLRLDSGLRLQLEGKITSDVEVVAALSDQNTPIQPEGNTQSLQEIDKVYIQIQSPHLQATLGDFSLSYTGGRFGNYQRKLQGARLALTQNSLQATISGAVSRGKFHTLQFKGEEGMQGPYLLRGSRGETEIIVLAGTERIWVDGELMTRGEENDYVIEYGSAQITFTRKRLITADSRIEVDFEYSDLKFQRNLYNAQFGGSGWRDRLKFSATMIREADDRNNPLEGELSAEEKKLLAQIGDHSDSAFVESGRYVGSAKGNYVRVDSAGIRFYRYAGENMGDYQVQFSYVGEGAGDYRYSSGGRYRYVSAAQGNYTPRRYLPLAQSQNLAAFLLQLQPSRTFNLTSEFAFSQTDLNLWSSRDDRDNLGTAFQLQAEVQPSNLRIKQNNLGQFQLTGLWRQQNKNFTEITRNQEVEYNRKWDLSPTGQGLSSEENRGESVTELQGGYSPWQGVQLRTDLGEVQQGDWFRSRRLASEFSLRRAKLPEVFYRQENIARSDDLSGIKGDWLRRLAQAQYQVWRLRPNLRYEFEDKRDRTSTDSLRSGFAFDDWTAGLAVQLAKPLEISFAQNERRDRVVVEQTLRDQSAASAQKFTVQLSRWRNLQMNFTYTNRVRRYWQNEQPEKRTRLADLVVTYSPWRQALSTDFRLQMSTTQISKTEQVYFKVEQGQGGYRFDTEMNEYIPDPFGEYILRTLATGEFEPVNDLLLNGKVTIKPRLFWQQAKKRPDLSGLVPSKLGWRSLLGSLAWEIYFALNEKSRRDNPWRLHFDETGLFFPDLETVYGRYTLRQDFFLFENSTERSLRFRWLENYEKNNRLTDGGQYSLQQEQSLRFTSRLSRRFSLQSNLVQQHIDRIFQSAGRINRKILSRGGDLRFSYRPQTSLEIAAEVNYLRDQDRVYQPATQTTLTGLKPNFTYAFRGKGRLRGEFEFSQVSAEPANRIIPYEMADGRRVGKNLRWQISLDYRLSSRFMILVSYLGRREPGRNETLHLGKAEVKAFF